jgi:hypothetical protein
MAVENDLLINELKQDVERERWLALWARHRALIIGGIGLVVLAVAGHSYWQHATREKNMVLTTALYDAFAPESKADPKSAADNLASFAADNAGTSAAMMAQIQAASLLVQAGDVPAALKTLGAALDAKDADANLKAVATLTYVQLALDTEDAAALQTRLEPYLDATDPYRFLAWELAALLAYRQNDGTRAQEYLNKIIDDNDAPVGVRGRAQSLQRVLK